MGIRNIWSTTRIQQLVTESNSKHSSNCGPPEHGKQNNEQDQSGATISSFSSDSEYDKEIANRILAASLPFVHKNGWTKNAISEGAESLGYAGVVHGLFPRGGVELVNYFYTTCNEKLVEQMKLEAEMRSNEKKPEPEVIVRNAVEARLRMIVPFLDTWSEALVLMTLPPNVPTSLANLLTLADDICYYAGDRSVDVRWYSRRIALATVYKVTELYLIQDKSDDYKATWEFLRRRIEEALKLQSILDETGVSSKFAIDAITATFETARTILRLNR